MKTLTEAIEERRAEKAEDARKQAEEAGRKRQEQERFVEIVKAKFPEWLGINLEGCEIKVATAAGVPGKYQIALEMNGGYVRLENPVSLDDDDLLVPSYRNGYKWVGVRQGYKLDVYSGDATLVSVQKAFLDAAMYAMEDE